MGYRNWRQRWCKKEGNKVLGKELLLVLLHLHVLNIGFLSHFSFDASGASGASGALLVLSI